MPVSGFLRAGLPAPSQPPPAPPLAAAAGSGRYERWQRNGALTVIAGVGVLLLAMGVGVLIGRASSSPPPAAPEVVTIGATPSAGASTQGHPSEVAFTSSWPSGKSGYAVQLQTLPEAGTTVSQVEQARSSAAAKGATAVGVLKSEEFSSLPTGNFIVYSGEYAKRAEALKALSRLVKTFAGAKVIRISNGSSAGAGRSGAAAKGSGANIDHPAPPSVLENAGKAKGKSYEEKSKSLPDVVETG